MGLFDWLGGKKEKPAGAWKPEVKAEPQGVTRPKPPPEKHLRFEELRPDIRALARPTWKPVVSTEEGEPGASRFGGRPGLLASEPWPTCGVCNSSMAFFLQIDLGDAPGSFGTGLLQLFYCTDLEGDCFQRDSDSVIQLVRIIDPTQVAFPQDLPKVEEFPAGRVTGWTELRDIPTCEEIREMGVELTDEYERSIKNIRSPHQHDKLGGWPAWVQGVDYPKCAVCHTKMSLIFQLDSDCNVPYLWGDLGCGHIMRCPQHPNVVTYSWDCS